MSTVVLVRPVNELDQAIRTLRTEPPRPPDLVKPLIAWLTRCRKQAAQYPLSRHQEIAATKPALAFARAINEGAHRP